MKKTFALMTQPIDVILTVHANNATTPEQFTNDYNHVRNYPATSKETYRNMHNLINTYGHESIKSFIVNVLKRKAA